MSARLVADERGTGLVSSVAGLIVFWAFLLLAVQLLAGLYARTTVSAAGFHAARMVASRSVDHGDPGAVEGAQRAADAAFHRLAGPMADDAVLRWRVEADQVHLHVTVDSPAFVPTRWLRGGHGRRIDRDFAVRIEVLR